jgi:lipoyl(octanoyl) transferase
VTRICELRNLRLVTYENGMHLQQKLVSLRQSDAIPDQLLLLEHPPVITLGRGGDAANLLASREALRANGVRFFETTRGGDITYHGPGQIVGYPILDLNGIRRDVVWYVRQLEECMIRATSSFGIPAFRVPGRTGVWVDGNTGHQASPREEKLAAIGVHISRWVTSHGFAYNVSTDLRFFELIIPCGIAGCRASSLEKLLGVSVSTAEAMARLSAAFGEVFGLELIAADASALDGWLASEAQPLGAATP